MLVGNFPGRITLLTKDHAGCGLGLVASSSDVVEDSSLCGSMISVHEYRFLGGLYVRSQHNSQQTV